MFSAPQLGATNDCEVKIFGQIEMDEKLESNHILTMRTGLLKKALQC